MDAPIPASAALPAPAGARRFGIDGYALALAWGLAGMCALAIATMDWPGRAQWTVLVFAATTCAWVLTDRDDTWISLVAVLALVGSGAIEPQQVYQTLGDPVLWLMLAAFVIAAVLERSGLALRLSISALGTCRSAISLLLRLVLVITLTAFLIPSTSGRAALLLPLFESLRRRVLRPTLVKALAMAFPTLILLSAGISLLGAGAHLLATEAMRQTDSGWRLNYLTWTLMAAPFVVLSCLLGVWAVSRTVLTPADRQLLLSPEPPNPVPWTAHQKAVGLLMVLAVLAWASTPWHGVPAPLIGLAFALLAAQPGLTGVGWKTALQGVEWNLMMFMAATLAIADALVASGAAQRMSEALSSALVGLPAWLVWVCLSCLALLSHLVITSRTARVAVLIPTVALPLAATGLDVSIVIFVLVLGSGFCQSLPVSAKPVALFNSQGWTDTHDWLRLSAWLALPMAALLCVFALFVWPWMAARLSL